MPMRELRVEDALLYLDQVKVEFGDRPHIYNEFLDIMKTFKTQQIDTPGVIRRVSNLFQGNRRLVLGFNTFLPEGYRIELPDGDGPPVAVFRAPGEVAVRHDLSGPNVPPIRQQQRPHEPQPQQGVPPEVALALGRTGGMQGTPGQQQQQGHVVPPGFEVMMGGRVGPVGPPPQQQHHHKHNGVMMDRMVGGVSGLANKVVMHAQQMGDPRGQQQQLQKQQQQQQQQQQKLGQHHAMGSGPTRGRPAETPQSHGHIGMPQQPQSQPGRSGMVMGQGNSQPSQHVIAQQQQQQQQQQMIGGTNNSTSTSTQNKQPSVANNGGAPPHQQQQQSPGVGQPLEFDHAINYVTTIKKRFADEPETYKKFLEILHTYQKEQRGIKEVLEEVSVLFEEHPDLLKEFTFFLPDAVQSEAKQQLEIVVKEAEERRAQKLAAAKQTAPQPKQRKQYVAPTPAPPPPVEIRPPSTSIAFGATAPRSVEREKEIHRSTVYGTVSFGPPRPPRKNVPTVAEAAKKEGRPTMLPPLPPQPITAETAFFERAKRHLSRRELAPDKPTGRARHTPYAEFLKCLHLFGSGVLNKDELVLLLRGLFVQGHAPKSGVNAGGGASNPAIATDAHELLNEFQEILIGRGPYADQQCSQKDKSNYGAKRSRDFELITRPTPSYAEYPKDYPHDLFMSHTGQTEEDLQVLNNILVSPFACNCSIKKRRNLYEEAMFRIEDERFEVDMAIERNALAMRKIEPIAEEVQMLREGEEKDGQPIGRLQYRLNPRTLNSIQINSIGRVYGENGDEVIQYLARNPLAVLPIIYQRLRQKDLEWRKQKGEMMPRWKAGCEANYEGSLDNLCHYKRRSLERTFGSEQLRDECKLARKYCSSQNNRKDNFVRFGLSVPDKSAVLYEPYAVVEMKPSSSVHHDAVDLLIQHVEIRCATRDDIREKAGRIWTEFMLCFFNYQSIWVEEEARKSFLGKINNSVVQYAIGERVMTTFGEGTIHSFTETDDEGPQYSVKLSSGFRTLQPPAVLHNIDANDGSKYFRRNDEMVKELDNTFDGSSSVIVDKKFKVLFGTDSIYIFLRLYSFLISLLDDIKEYLLNNPTIVDPSLSYYNPMKSADDRHKEESKFDFATVIVKLHEVLAKKMSHKEFESFARLVNRDIVHKIAALPKLVQRCGDMMIKMSEEDLLPHIYDVCQYSGQNPVTLRSTCMSISPSAEYRIQYNASNGRLYFSYLSEEEELSTVPMGDDDDDDDDMEDGEMEDDYDDEDDMDLDNEAEDLREVKRMKVR